MSVSTKQEITKRPPTILVVEDDGAIMDVLRTLFEREGMRIVSATTGSEALQRVAQSQIDLVVLDLMLPDMSGYDVCARLRRPYRAPIPVLMLTALGLQNQMARGLELGADDYLVKPFDPQELVLRVTGLLGRSAAACTAER